MSYDMRVDLSRLLVVSVSGCMMFDGWKIRRYSRCSILLDFHGLDIRNQRLARMEVNFA